jgi:hypothetical protein
MSMSHQIDAAAGADLPAEAAASAEAKPGWKLVEDAPAPEPPDIRSRAGAQRGMVLLLVGGGLFWTAVAAAVWLAVG